MCRLSINALALRHQHAGPWRLDDVPECHQKLIFRQDGGVPCISVVN